MSIKKTKNNKAFTLIELLVVIAIIGLLSTLAIVAVNSARDSAKEAKADADMKQIVTAMELKRDESNTHLIGVTGSGCTRCSCGPPYDFENSTCITRLRTTFQNLGFPDILYDPWGDPYLIDENEYEQPSNLCRRDSLWSINGGSTFVPFFICN